MWAIRLLDAGVVRSQGSPSSISNVSWLHPKSRPLPYPVTLHPASKHHRVQPVPCLELALLACQPHSGIALYLAGGSGANDHQGVNDGLLHDLAAIQDFIQSGLQRCDVSMASRVCVSQSAQKSNARLMDGSPLTIRMILGSSL